MYSRFEIVWKHLYHSALGIFVSVHACPFLRSKEREKREAIKQRQRKRNRKGKGKGKRENKLVVPSPNLWRVNPPCFLEATEKKLPAGVDERKGTSNEGELKKKKEREKRNEIGIGLFISVNLLWNYSTSSNSKIKVTTFHPNDYLRL